MISCTEESIGGVILFLNGLLAYLFVMYVMVPPNLKHISDTLENAMTRVLLLNAGLMVAGGLWLLVVLVMFLF